MFPLEADDDCLAALVHRSRVNFINTDMKSRNMLHIDEDHGFDPKAAFVAESWIVKGVDSIFPNKLAEFAARIAKTVKNEVDSDLAKKYDDWAARFEAIEKSKKFKSNGCIV